MRRAKKRGPGPSHLLMTPDHAGNVVGIDPHKHPPGHCRRRSGDLSGDDIG